MTSNHETTSSHAQADWDNGHDSAQEFSDSGLEDHDVEAGLHQDRNGTQTNGVLDAVPDSTPRQAGVESAGTDVAVANGKGVAPAESESTEATRNQPVASTKGVSLVNDTPSSDGDTTVVDQRQRVSPSSKAFNWVLVVGLLFGGACAVFISFYSIMSFVIAAGWPPAIAWAFPAFIDIMLIISAGTVLSYKADGKSAWKAWLWLVVFSASSVYANVMHALALPNEQVLWIWGSAGLAALVPVGVFAATELVSDVAIDNPASRKEERAEQAMVEDEQLQRVRERELADTEHQLRLSRLTKTSEAKTEAEVRSVKHSSVWDNGRGQSTSESRTPAQSSDSDTVQHTTRGQSASAAQGQSTKGRTDPAPVSEVAELVISRTAQGLDTTKHEVINHFDLDPAKQGKTAYRRLRDLRGSRPEIFLAEGVQS